MKKNKKRIVYVAATLYAFITGLSFLFVKIALKSSNPIELLAFRFTSSFIMIILLIAFRIVKVNFTKEKIMKILPLSLLYPLFFFSLQVFGLSKATSLEAGILNAIIPVFTLVLATHFLKEKTTIFQKVSIVLSVVGVIYITVNKGTGQGNSSVIGFVLLFLSALSFSSYTVLKKRITNDFSSIELSFILNIIAFISFNILSLGNHFVNGTISNFFLPLKSPSFIISVMYLGVLSSLGTSLLLNYALSNIDASKMSVFANLATVIAIFAGAIILNESIYHFHLIGSVLILFGVLGTNFLDKKHLK